jgi:hypothetical protein
MKVLEGMGSVRIECQRSNEIRRRRTIKVMERIKKN